MLHYETIDPQTLQLLRTLQNIDDLNDSLAIEFPLIWISFPQLFDFYRFKYPDGNSFLVFKRLVYFEDAELEPMPRMIVPIDWEEIKKRIIFEVKTHFP